MDLRSILGIHLLLGHSGEVIGIVKLHEQFLLQLMADFVFIQVCNMHARNVASIDLLH